MNDAVLNINATFGKRAADAERGSLEAKVKASMRAVIRENWMETRDEGLFRAGLGGALLSVGMDSEDGRELQRSIERLKKTSGLLVALQSGVPVDLEAMLKEQENEAPVFPLMAWWHEVKASPSKGEG